MKPSMKLGVLLILGMGYQGRKQRQATYIKNKIHELIPSENAPVEYVNYYEYMEKRQADLFNAMKSDALGGPWNWLRKLTIEQLGDAATYLHRAHAPDSAYREVHSKVMQGLIRLREKTGPDTPLVILAGSLGALIIMDYICDREDGLDEHLLSSSLSETDIAAAKDFHHLKLMLTWGCNIPMFLGGASKPYGFSKPHPDFHWYNFYGKPDILGWPLKHLNHKESDSHQRSFNELVTEDIHVNIGGTPLIHENYWYHRKSRQLMLTKLAKCYANLHANVNK